jgi:hypothetical protein
MAAVYVHPKSPDDTLKLSPISRTSKNIFRLGSKKTASAQSREKPRPLNPAIAPSPGWGKLSDSKKLQAEASL